MEIEDWSSGSECEKHQMGWCALCKPAARIRAPKVVATEGPASAPPSEPNVRTQPWRLRLDLRDWQSDALLAWERAGFRGVIEAATGTGKTAVALSAAERVRQAHGPMARVVVVVPTQALAQQWVRSFQQQLGVPKELIGELHSAARLRFSADTVVLITVVNTARTKVPEIIDGWTRSGRTVLLMVDECHRVGSEWNAKVVATSADRTLGLSATPERSDGGHEQHIYPGLGEPVYRYTLLKALDDEVLAPVRSVNLYVDFTAVEEREWAHLGGQLSEALAVLESERPGITSDERTMWKHISELAAREDPAAKRVVALVAERRRLVSEAHSRQACLQSIERWLVEQGHRSIVFHETIDAAEVAKAELCALGAAVSLDHSGRPRDVRETDLKRFRDTRSTVLVAVRSLDEGIDVPDASVAVIAAGSRSPRQRIQRLGRILRQSEGKQALAISILVRSTPEESEVGRRDEALLGAHRVVHHRWPGRPVPEAVDQPSSYVPAQGRWNRVDRLSVEGLGPSIQRAKVQSQPTPAIASTAGGYVAAATRFSPNGWHPVSEVRTQSGMPPEDFDRIRPDVRRSFYRSLDPELRKDDSKIYGGEIEAIQRTWRRSRRSTLQ